ncbi:oligomeric complex COG6 [Basidiobolus meristosporus CBS 931.73]|uniref:Conserved oligomeric Golgi complex subunit 6 n=1 Tax=Basidiobolus meristosporus CBS 931.73 TaxID=1314790 RepID=A0A1Y1YMW2_9FUNG|nr:oligomeric complex COG6 [Basidiobolus meristosporus CBS 931.73]|eukprot:ORX99362.1 oligomeric complex COG6 [Basidiobolus meristosporus CBS 931.73]
MESNNLGIKFNPLSQKLNKVLSSNLDDPNEKLALEALSEFYQQNTLEARRNLRSDIEKRSLSINKRFLEAFGHVNKEIEKIDSELKEITASCVEIQNEVDITKSKTVHLLEKSAVLKSERKKAEAREIIAKAFLDTFTLSAEEIEVLGSTDGPLEENFFAALTHLQRIHKDCQTLVSTGRQSVGTEIMNSLTSVQDVAFDKLFKWSQSECRILGRDSPDVTPTLKMAIKELRQRPDLYRACMEEMTGLRRNTIVRYFIDALTRGGPGGMPRPIEIYAHDPMRYVGDMLAWVHQTVASELEMLEALYDIKLDTEHSNTTDAHDDLVENLNRIVEGVARPLKVRIEQVLNSSLELTIRHRLSNLIQFYTSTIKKTLGTASHLIDTLQQIQDLAFDVFFSSLNEYAYETFSETESPGADLTPPAALKSTVAKLKEIMSSYETSLVGARRDLDYSRILDGVLDPLLRMCRASSQDLDPIARSVYLINCIQYLQVSLSRYQCTEEQMQLLNEETQGHSKALTEQYYIEILNKSGLVSVKNQLEGSNNEATPIPVEELDPQLVADAMAQFNRFLSDFNTSYSPLGKLNNSQLRSKIREDAIKRLLEFYAQFYEAMKSNETGLFSSVVMRNPSQVETLLGV